MSRNGLIEFFCHIYVQSTPKQQIQKDFYAWSIVHTSTQNKQLGRVQSRDQDTTAVKGRGKESQKLYYDVIGTHIVFFWVSVKRMVCLSLILSVLCLGDNISEDFQPPLLVLRSGWSLRSSGVCGKGILCFYRVIMAIWPSEMSTSLSMWGEAPGLQELPWLSDFTGQTAQAEGTRQGLQKCTFIRHLFSWGAFLL